MKCAHPDAHCASPEFCDGRGKCVHPPRIGEEIAPTKGRRLHVICDVDEVVAALLPAWIAKYNRDFADTLKLEDITSWDLRDHVIADAHEAMYAYLDTPKIYDSVKPIEGALEGVLILRARGHRVTFVTSAMNGHAGAKLRWLQKHEFLPAGRKVDPDYIECSDKTLIRGDLLIDDRPKNIEEFPGARILFSQPHNLNVAAMSLDAYRARVWDDVVELVEQYATSQPIVSGGARVNEVVAERQAVFGASIVGKMMEMTGALTLTPSRCGTCQSVAYNPKCSVCRSLREGIGEPGAEIITRAPRTTTLPEESAARKNVPLVTGLLDYFPAALAEVAELSRIGNEQHNPGEPMHWARGKSMDHPDCIVRHLADRGIIDKDGKSHTVKVAWRSLALLQEECEANGAPMSRGSRVAKQAGAA